MIIVMKRIVFILIFLFVSGCDDNSQKIKELDSELLLLQKERKSLFLQLGGSEDEFQILLEKERNRSPQKVKEHQAELKIETEKLRKELELARAKLKEKNKLKAAEAIN